MAKKKRMVVALRTVSPRSGDVAYLVWNTKGHFYGCLDVGTIRSVRKQLPHLSVSDLGSVDVTAEELHANVRRGWLMTNLPQHMR